MFKQTRSIVIWFYLIKYRKKIALSISLLLMAYFSNLIYADIVQYLQLSNKIHLLAYILPLKWLVIIFCIYFSTLQFLNIFSNNKIKKNENKKKIEEIKKNENEFSKKEEIFLYKKNLKSKACFLIKK